MRTIVFTLQYQQSDHTEGLEAWIKRTQDLIDIIVNKPQVNRYRIQLEKATSYHWQGILQMKKGISISRNQFKSWIGPNVTIMKSPEYYKGTPDEIAELQWKHMGHYCAKPVAYCMCKHCIKAQKQEPIKVRIQSEAPQILVTAADYIQSKMKQLNKSK